MNEHRCRSVFNIGGYNSAFLPFFSILKFWGDIQVFADFSNLNDFENLWVYSLFRFNKNLLKQLKTRIKKHKINKLCVHNKYI